MLGMRRCLTNGTQTALRTSDSVSHRDYTETDWRGATGVQSSPCWGTHSADAVESQLLWHRLRQRGQYCVIYSFQFQHTEFVSKSLRNAASLRNPATFTYNGLPNRKHDSILSLLRPFQVSRNLSTSTANDSNILESHNPTLATFKGLKVAVYTVDKTEIILTRQDLIQLVTVRVIFCIIIELHVVMSCLFQATRSVKYIR